MSDDTILRVQLEKAVEEYLRKMGEPFQQQAKKAREDLAEALGQLQFERERAVKLEAENAALAASVAALAEVLGSCAHGQAGDLMCVCDNGGEAGCIAGAATRVLADIPAAGRALLERLEQVERERDEFKALVEGAFERGLGGAAQVRDTSLTMCRHFAEEHHAYKQRARNAEDERDTARAEVMALNDALLAECTERADAQDALQAARADTERLRNVLAAESRRCQIALDNSDPSVGGPLAEHFAVVMTAVEAACDEALAAPPVAPPQEKP